MAKTCDKNLTASIKSVKSSAMKGIKKVSAAVTTAVQPLKRVQTLLLALSSKIPSIAGSIHSASSASMQGNSGI
jgi:hypothetical protein